MVANEPWPVAVTKRNAAGPIIFKGRCGTTRREAHLNISLLLTEICQTWNEPSKGECRPDPNGQNACAGLCGHLGCQGGESIEDGSEARLIGEPGRRHGKPVRFALEQRYAKPVLQQMHHSADRGGRHIQLTGSTGKAAMSGGRLECLDTVEKGQPSHCDHQEN